VAKNPNFYPVILAGGRGTRFWPLSRKKRAKQLLALDGKQTMIQQTVARLLPLAQPKQFWIVTNDDLRPAILKQLPKLPSAQVLAEPLGRNTAPAIGLAAFLLLRAGPAHRTKGLRGFSPQRKSLDAKPRPLRPLKGLLISDDCGIAEAMP